MKPLFWIPFTTGVFHSMCIIHKQEKDWTTTLSILGTTSAYNTLAVIREEYFLKPEYQKTIPSKLSVPGFIGTSFVAAAVHTGAFFCLGHLLTNKAYAKHLKA